MVTIPGASQFLNAATLANTRGLSAQTPSLLGSSASATSLLDAGRSINANNGIGLSASSRALTQQLLSSTAAEANALFSLAGGGSATVEAAQTQILALRSQTATSQLARSLVEVVDDGGVTASENGQQIDTEA